MDPRHKNLIVAITGASGACYARMLCAKLASSSSVDRIGLIVSANGYKVAAYEDSTAWMDDARYTRFDNDDLFAPPASGSARFDAMVIVPCSMGTLGRIAAGTSDNLLCRAADVMLKERRPLIVVPRETPLSTIHLHNMLRLAEAGATIAPASASFYAHPQNMDQLALSVVDRILSLLNVDSPRFEWGASSR